MKTAAPYVARSGMVTEYLRYVWSRPVAVRIAVENTAVPRPVPAGFRKLPGQQSILVSALAWPTISKTPDSSGRVGTRGLSGLSLIAVSLILALPSARAQTQPVPDTNAVTFVQICCPETSGPKFLQHPQLPGGLHVKASHNVVVAAEFVCKNTGPVSDIHLWGSWLQDNIDPAALFTLTIWSDVPRHTNGAIVTPGHPGVVLWTEPFGPGEYYQCLYSKVTEQFYDPSIPAVVGGDNKLYYLCFYPKNPFWQEGTAGSPTNYWLSISTQTTDGAQLQFGWHTSAASDNDPAVRGNAPFPVAWNALIDPQGNPLTLAFKVTTLANNP